MTMLFLIFSSIALVSGVMLIRAKNPVHSAVLFPISVFCHTSGLLLLLGLDFLAMIFLVVYVGAIAVSFSFAVMRSKNIKIQIHENVLRYFLPVGGIMGPIFLVCEIFLMVDHDYIPILPGLNSTYTVFKLQSWTNMETLGNLLYTTHLVLWLSSLISWRTAPSAPVIRLLLQSAFLLLFRTPLFSSLSSSGQVWTMVFSCFLWLLVVGAPAVGAPPTFTFVPTREQEDNNPDLGQNWGGPTEPVLMTFVPTREEEDNNPDLGQNWGGPTEPVLIPFVPTREEENNNPDLGNNWGSTEVESAQSEGGSEEDLNPLHFPIVFNVMFYRHELETRNIYFLDPYGLSRSSENIERLRSVASYLAVALTHLGGGAEILFELYSSMPGPHSGEESVNRWMRGK